MAEPLIRHEVDLKRLAASVLHRSLARRSSRIGAEDFADALQFLTLEAWRTAETFDPERGLDFAGYAGRRLKHRLIDYQRKTGVDRRYARQEVRGAIRFPDALDEHGEVPADSSLDPVERLVRDELGGDSPDSQPFGGRLALDRDLRRAEDLALLADVASRLRAERARAAHERVG